MMTLGPVEQQEHQQQRLQCARVLTTLLLLLSTFMLLQQQPPRRQQKRRQKEQEPFVSPDTSAVDLVFLHSHAPRGLWVRGSGGSGAVLANDFIASVPPNFAIPDDTGRGTGHKTSEELAISTGDCFRNPGALGPLRRVPTLRALSRSLPTKDAWVVEVGSKWGAPLRIKSMTPVNSSTYPSLLAVYQDSRLFKKTALPGCTGHVNASCTLALVKFPVVACLYDITASANSDEHPEASYTTRVGMPWTCAAAVKQPALPLSVLYHSEAEQHAYWDKWLSQQGSLESLPGADDAGEPGCVRLISGKSVESIMKYAKLGITSPWVRSNNHAGVVAQFCGSPLPQLISVDVITLRVYFIQRNASHIADSVATQWCVAYVALDTYYRDVSRCVPLGHPLPSNTPAQTGKPNREPVYMHVDAYADALYIGVFHEEDLMLYVYRGSDMQMAFAFNVVGFRSGRLLSGEFTSLGKILVAGDCPPYMRRLDVFDLTSGIHENIEVPLQK